MPRSPAARAAPPMPLAPPFDDAPKTGTNPAELETGPSLLSSTGFGALGGESRPAPLADKTSPFDVCHVGVVLRAVLFVHGVLGIGVAFLMASLDTWWRQLASLSAVTMPALLVWLLAACMAREALSRLPEAAQWALALAAGSACALAARALWFVLPWPEVPPGDALQTTAVALAGAAMAGAFFHWLRQHARLQVPAATTARLAELQSRIRPHFLFNTLNTAVALVRTDPSRAESVLEDLAELFRVALTDDGPQAASTLAAEIELARRYLEIEQLRFGPRLQVRWELDPKGDGARLPPLLLQPLVENAVRHGVEPAAQGGMLRVRTRVRRGQVEIVVANSLPERAANPGHGIGLRNVRERLRLMHDVAADFRARKHGDVYRVQIVVPL